MTPCPASSLLKNPSLPAKPFSTKKTNANYSYPTGPSPENPTVTFFLKSVISGQYRNRLVVHNTEQIKDIARRKFLDYDRLITEQIGPLRLSLRRKTEAEAGYKTKSPIYVSKRS